ncbi:MAG: hypothetical protein LBC65_04675, partial [Oscillospiraceae bacterium]|nr:hypothetical protein [Oscillospiraceae bacterium]
MSVVMDQERRGRGTGKRDKAFQLGEKPAKRFEPKRTSNVAERMPHVSAAQRSEVCEDERVTECARTREVATV